MKVYINYLNMVKDSVVVTVEGTQALVEWSFGNDKGYDLLALDSGYLVAGQSLWPSLAKNIAKALGWNYSALVCQ